MGFGNKKLKVFYYFFHLYVSVINVIGFLIIFISNEEILKMYLFYFRRRLSYLELQSFVGFILVK